MSPSCLSSARWLALSSVSLRGRWLLIIEDEEHAVGFLLPRLNVVVTFSTCQETLEAQRRFLQLRTVMLLSLIMAFVSWMELLCDRDGRVADVVAFSLRFCERSVLPHCSCRHLEHFRCADGESLAAVRVLEQIASIVGSVM